MTKPKKRPTRRRRSPLTSNHRVDEFLHQVGIRPRMVADDFWEQLCSLYGEQANTFLDYVDRRRTAEKADTSYHENVDSLYRLKNASLDFSIALSSQYFGRLYSNYLAVVTTLGLDKNANRILDLGCDNGLLSAFYATHFPGASVLGIDRCDEAISCAKALKRRLQLRNLSFLAADAFSESAPADVPLKTWDIVFMTLCGYEEVDRSSGPEQVAKRFHEYLRPGGVGVVAEYPNSPVLADLLVYGGRTRQWTLAYQAFGGDEQVVEVAEIEAIRNQGAETMETIGENIVEMQEMIHTVLSPPPAWIRGWQTEAEHVLAMAHLAKDQQDIDKLIMLDEEARKLVEKRKAKLATS